MNKKGLATGILAIMIVLFVFAITSAITMSMYSYYEDAIMSLDNSTVDMTVKQQIQDAGDMIFWADKIFVALFIILLASYLISSVTLPPDEPVYFLVFLGILILAVILSMGLSNIWTYMLQQPDLIDAAQNLKFIDFFMRYFPLIVFVTGLLGAILFYARKSLGNYGGFNNQGLGGVDFGE